MHKKNSISVGSSCQPRQPPPNWSKPGLLCEEPISGAFIRRERIPVSQDHVPDTFGKGNITIRMVLRPADMYLHRGMRDIGTFEVT